MKDYKEQYNGTKDFVSNTIQIDHSDLKWFPLSETERDAYILSVLKTLRNPCVASGDHRRHAWDDGWRSNLERFKVSKNTDDLIPGYHGKFDIIRYSGDVVRSVTPLLDYRIHCRLVDWTVKTYLSDVSEIYEFGCGPAYHLLRARSLNKTAALVGLDWSKSSQLIIETIRDLKIDTNISGHSFDFFKPYESPLCFGRNVGVLTVAAMEQLGSDFEPFLQYLLDKKPAVCVHLEPIDELMDMDNLLDWLSVQYCRKRNYLSGFLTRLRELESEKKVVIHRQQRTHTGSFFIEGHSLVVWSPI